MAVRNIRPAGGLSEKDQETVRQWMVAGHSLKNGKIQGTVPARAAATITPGTSNQVIPAGVYLEGEQTIQGSANLLGENIARGVTIFGVTGTASILRPTLTYLVDGNTINSAVIGTLNGGNGWYQDTNRGAIRMVTYDLVSCYFTQAFDVTDFRSLSFKQMGWEGYTQNGYYIRVGLTTTVGGNFATYATISSEQDGAMAAVDISGLRGYYYLKFEKYHCWEQGVRQVMIGI